jgi:Zn-dependent protease/CBS domain-containing protein
MLSLGRFFGVPVFIAPSWLLIVVLFTLIYAPALSAAVPGLSASGAYGAAIGFAVLLALCVLAHELGHTAMSLLLGQPVRRVVIFLMGGVSEVEGQLSRPRDELLVAAAGPLVSVGVTALAWAGYANTDHNTLGGALIVLLFWSNLALTIFNLLPGLPLDGGRLLRATMQAFGASGRVSTAIAAWTGRAVAAAVLIFGVTYRDPEWGTTSALISAALAFYLWVGASRSERISALLDRIPMLRAVELLRPGLFVPADTSVAEALDRAWAAHARGLITVDSSGQPVGIVDEVRAGAVAPERRPWTHISEVARPLEHGLVLPVELEGEALVAALRATPSREYLVVNKDGSAAGMLSSADIAAALQVRP